MRTPLTLTVAAVALATSLHAQDAATPSFDVASVKEAANPSPFTTSTPGRFEPGQFIARNSPLRTILARALRQVHLAGDPMVGGTWPEPRRRVFL